MYIYGVQQQPQTLSNKLLWRNNLFVHPYSRYNRQVSHCSVTEMGIITADTIPGREQLHKISENSENTENFDLRLQES